MCKAIMGGAPKMTPAPLPPEPAKVVTPQAAQQAGDKEKRRIKSGFGVQSTIATSGAGITSGIQTAGKTLLGQ